MQSPWISCWTLFQEKVKKRYSGRFAEKNRTKKRKHNAGLPKKYLSECDPTRADC